MATGLTVMLLMKTFMPRTIEWYNGQGQGHSEFNVLIVLYQPLFALNKAAHNVIE